MNQLLFLPEKQRTLCHLLGKNLFGEDFAHEKETDWNGVYEESVRQTVAALAFSGYRQLPMDVKLKQSIMETYNGCLYQYIQNCTYHSYLDYLMKENNLSYVVLKGVASALYYPQPELRQMGDVDFLIEKGDIEKASCVLEKDGFHPWEEDHICHIVFRKERMHYEMHFEPAGVPGGAAGEKIRSYLADIQETAREVHDDAFSYVVPDEFHHGLVQLLHMQHHLLSEGIGLRHLCDWAVFVHSFGKGEFEKMFREKLEAVGLWQFARIISLTAHLGLGLPQQNWMGKEKNLAADLLSDILCGGNFGNKDDQRMYEGMFISNRGKDGVRHTRFGQFIRTLNQVVYTHWPISRRIRLLLPPGWFFFGIRQIIRMATGKRRKVDFLKSYRKSMGRKELYRQLKLFETR